MTTRIDSERGRSGVGERLYRACGLTATLMTLLSVLLVPITGDSSMWFCTGIGYATALLIAWMERHPIARADLERNGVQP